jgi:hypothetical protein
LVSATGVYGLPRGREIFSAISLSGQPDIHPYYLGGEQNEVSRYFKELINISVDIANIQIPKPRFQIYFCNSVANSSETLAGIE